MKVFIHFILFLGAASVLSLGHSQMWPVTIPAPITEDGTGEGEVSCEQANEWMTSRGALFLDSSDAADFETSRIATAMHLPLDRLSGGDTEVFMELPRGVPLVVYCRVGCDSSQIVASRLREAGFDEVFVLGGGFEAWCAKNLPTDPAR